jgi:uroporphyrinogen decarboxylase
MYRQPEVWHSLMEKLTKMVCDYLLAQISHGVDAIQLFDSWVGCLSPEDYRTYVLRYTREIMRSVGGRVPRIHFCANSAHLIEDFVQTGADVLSVDWRLPIEEAWARSGRGGAREARGTRWGERDGGGRTGIQGNLDPVLALSGGDAMRAGVQRTLDQSSGQRGHVFSLGHGVLRETPPENLREVVRMVHETTRMRR